MACPLSAFLDGVDCRTDIARYVLYNLTAMLFYLLFEKHYKQVQRFYETRFHPPFRNLK